MVSILFDTWYRKPNEVSILFDTRYRYQSIDTMFRYLWCLAPTFLLQIGRTFKKWKITIFLLLQNHYLIFLLHHICTEVKCTRYRNDFEVSILFDTWYRNESMVSILFDTWYWNRIRVSILFDTWYRNLQQVSIPLSIPKYRYQYRYQVSIPPILDTTNCKYLCTVVLWLYVIYLANSQR